MAVDSTLTVQATTTPKTMVSTTTPRPSLMGLIHIVVLCPSLLKDIVNYVHNKATLLDTVQPSSICLGKINLPIITPLMLLPIPITHLLMPTLLLNQYLFPHNGSLTLMSLIMLLPTFKTSPHSPYNGSDDIMIGNGSSLSITHTSSTHFPSSSKSFVLSNMLCVPSMK